MPTPTISRYFAKHHEELDDSFKSFQMQKYNNYEKAMEAFKRFKNDLERHIVWEERLLFPLWEEKTGMMNSGPTVVMRGEHRHINERLAAISSKLEKGDPDTDSEELALTVLLTAHNMKEERVLYPSLDKLAKDQERDDLYDKMKTASAEPNKVCCDRGLMADA